MKARPLALALASLPSLFATAAFAVGFDDRARVVESRPVLEQIPVTRQECWNERVRAYEDRRVVRTDTGAPIGPGTVLGAVVGGVIGHQLGHSSGGRDRGTAAGAIVGGILGNQIDRQNQADEVETAEVERVPVDRDVERCREVREVREATVGYDVRYEYRGREFTTRAPRDPGRTIAVRVDVQPVPEPAYQPAPAPAYQPAPGPAYQPAPGPAYQPGPGPQPPTYTR